MTKMTPKQQRGLLTYSGMAVEWQDAQWLTWLAKETEQASVDGDVPRVMELKPLLVKAQAKHAQAVKDTAAQAARYKKASA